MRIEENGNLSLHRCDVLEGISEVDSLDDFTYEAYIAGRYAVLAGYEVHYVVPGKITVIAKPERGKSRKKKTGRLS